MDGFLMENPIKMDDLGVPLFLETPICIQHLHGTCSWNLGTFFFFFRFASRGSGLKQVRDMSQCKVNLSQFLTQQGIDGCWKNQWNMCVSLDFPPKKNRTTTKLDFPPPFSFKKPWGQEVDSQGNRRCDISGPTVEHIASAIHAPGSSGKTAGDFRGWHGFSGFPPEVRNPTFWSGSWKCGEA